jgi:hypothetical protein
VGDGLPMTTATQPETLPGVAVPPFGLPLTEPVWGIDPSTLRIAVGIVAPGDVVRWATRSLPSATTPLALRYSGAARALVPFFRELTELYGMPARLVVEEPFGSGQRTVHPSSNRMLGVTLACAGQVLGLQTVVSLVKPNTWKSIACGNGAIDPAGYLRWAMSAAEYSGDLEDEAAALGVATFAALQHLGRLPG